MMTTKASSMSDASRCDEQQSFFHQFEKNHIDHWMTDTLSISNRFHFSELLTKTGFGVRR
jgi:hypothetical protein